MKTTTNINKHIFFFLTTVILSFSCYSQISFDEGYYISNSGEKIDCLIKNIGWRKNPINFEYKKSENSEIKIASINSVREFVIYDKIKFLRSNVDIDRSSEITGNLSNNKNPDFKKERLFLKVLIEGKANLYSYIGTNVERYFYSQNDSIIPLVYKSYKVSQNKIAKNNQFRSQLWRNLKCGDISIKEIKRIDYEKDELINFFIKYNKCENSDFFSFNNKEKKKSFNLSLRAGLNNSSLTLDNENRLVRDIDFGNELSFRIGLEAEFVFSFNRNKWAFIVEPTYESFNTSVEVDDQTASVDYQSIEIPFGIRHYLFFNDNSKLFINSLIAIDFQSSNSIIDISNGTNFEIETSPSILFGVGYKYNNKYAVELRYLPQRNLLNSSSFRDANYSRLSLIFAYTLF